MRELNTLDTLKVATIIGKLGTNASEFIKEGMTDQQIGIVFFTTALTFAETDIRNLLASIAELTPEEFDAKPFDYPLDLIDELTEKEDLKLFLQKARKLAQKIQGKQ
jgi:hypothetical protein